MNGHPAEIRSVRADGSGEKSTDVLVSQETSFSRHSRSVWLSENASNIFWGVLRAAGGMSIVAVLSRRPVTVDG
jgi:hypothetical protein